MKRFLITCLKWGIPLVVVAALAWPKLPRAETGGPGAGRAERPPVAVHAERVSPQIFERTLRLHGTLLAYEGVEVRPEVNGLVSRVAFEEGRRVEAGDLLVKLNDDEIQAELRSITAELDVAERNERRLSDLRARGITSQQDYDEALGRLNVLRARAELLRTRIAKTEIRAPFGGTVGLRGISPGSYVTPQSVLALLNMTDRLKADFAVPERHQPVLREGLAVRVTAGGLPNPVEGYISAIQPQVNTGTRTILARAIIENKDNRLLPGNYAQIELVLETTDAALLVPSTAIVPGQRETRLFVIKDGVAEERLVQIGSRQADTVEIISGLEAGEEVVTRGSDNLRPGQRVRAQAS